MLRNIFVVFVLSLLSQPLLFSQNPQGDCPYPMLLIHGWTGNYESWEEVYTDPDFTSIWGGLADTIWTVNNAYNHHEVLGPDGIPFNGDDDILTTFNNENNILAPGCLYALDMMNFWNEDVNNPLIEKGNSWGLLSGESDSNESALKKSGPAVKAAITQILAANPTKPKVVVAGYSMGGLTAREYIQREVGNTKQWWVDPSKGNGHKIAKLFTVGTPHRGSNTLGNSSFTSNSSEDRNGNPDLFSEAVRDMRYSRSCGFLNLFDCPGLYLYGGDESTLGSWYWNNDVDCDGDEDSPNVEGINISGKTQFGSSYDEWDGTKENPTMKMPRNIKYTYYVSNLAAVGCNPNWTSYGCAGDGVIDDERQWIYQGGDGKTDSYLEGISIPSPKEGIAYRLSDRISSTNRISHVGQQGDMEFIIRGFDEGDYPRFAHLVRRNIWYAGLAQIRPEQVPLKSELTFSGNRMIDGDWYRVNISQGRKMRLRVKPNMDMDMRMDIYTNKPGINNNRSGQISLIVPKNTLPEAILETPVLAKGSYYFRITNWLNTATDSSTAWKTAYQYRVEHFLPAARPQKGDFTLLSTYPQPASDMLHVHVDYLNPESEVVSFQLLNLNSETVYQSKKALLLGENRYEIPVSGLVSGFYFLVIQTEKGREVRKIVVK